MGAAILLFLPTSHAQSDLNVSKVVYETLEVEAQEGASYVYTTYGKLAWLANYENISAGWGIFLAHPVNEFVPMDFSIGGITGSVVLLSPQRDNWLAPDTSVPNTKGDLYVDLQDNDTQTFYIAFNRSGSYILSCAITVEAKKDVYQCGEPPLNPLTGLTLVNIAEGANMSYQIRHDETVQDVQRTNFSYEYELQNTVIPGIWHTITPTSSVKPGNMISYAWFNTSDWEEDLTSYVAIRARAKDDITREVSQWSCAVAGTIGETSLGPYSCLGVFSRVDLAEQGDANFPFANVPGLADGLGVSLAVAGGILGGLFALCLVLWLTMQAGIVGGVISGSLSIGFLYSLNIIPVWGVVLLFTLSCLIILLFFTQRRQPA